MSPNVHVYTNFKIKLHYTLSREPQVSVEWHTRDGEAALARIPLEHSWFMLEEPLEVGFHTLEEEQKNFVYQMILTTFQGQQGSQQVV